MLLLLAIIQIIQFFVVNLYNLLVVFINSMVSTIGHLKQGDPKVFYEHFQKLHFINFALRMLFMSGFLSVADETVKICYGFHLTITHYIVLLLAINYFIQYQRRACMAFREATGCYYYDRYRGIIEGIINVVLDLILVNFVGIVGVLIPTISTNLLISPIVEPFVLYKHVFKKSVKPYYFINYILIAIFTIAIFFKIL